MVGIPAQSARRQGCSSPGRPLKTRETHNQPGISADKTGHLDPSRNRLSREMIATSAILTFGEILSPCFKTTVSSSFTGGKQKAIHRATLAWFPQVNK